MIPIKDKKYMLNCQGPYDYNRYMGEGAYTGEVKEYFTDDGDVLSYGFKILGTTEICFFLKEEIVAEFDNGLIKESEQIQDQIDSENHYCEKCGSCGETGCCPPINCEAVTCKYGEINLKDYKCFQNQWEIMLNALEDIAHNYNLDDGNILRQHLAQLAQNALKAVDKEWHKLYSKEQNDY